MCCIALILTAGAETWMGRHPAVTAATVLDIARQAEMVFNHSGHYQASTRCLCRWQAIIDAVPSHIAHGSTAAPALARLSLCSVKR